MVMYQWEGLLLLPEGRRRWESRRITRLTLREDTELLTEALILAPSSLREAVRSLAVPHDFLLRPLIAKDEWQVQRDFQ
jgi:hypothetical protein